MTDPVPTARVLLVDDDPTTLATFRRLLELEADLGIETATDGLTALASARAIVPDLIISDYEMPRMDGFELCRQVKADPALAGTMFLVLTGHTATTLKVKGLNLGVDDYLTKPVEAAELSARVRAMLRTKRLHDQLRDDKLEMERLHAELGESFEHLLSLLIHLMDLSMPGAAERGRRLAVLCRQLAEHFNIPAPLYRDLELAALLHELGKVVDPTHRRDSATSPGFRPADDWQHTVPGVSLMGQVEQLKGAAELIGSMFENWDGSGVPNHILQGQIPLRSRLLRVGVDFLSLTAGTGTDVAPATPADSLGALQEHRGTWYDPLVLIHLESIVLESPTSDWRSDRLHVPIEELKEGMVLAGDLCTTSGVKLLSAGATIGRGTLGIILRRHSTDPIVQGAWVVKR